MTSNFNKLIEHRLSLTNCSLLSEVTDIDDISFMENKHVRFNPHSKNDKNNNINFLSSSIVSDASLLDSESKCCNSNIVIIPEEKCNLKNGITQYRSGFMGHLNSPVTNSDYQTVDEYTTIGDQNDDNDNTSIWSSETDASINDNITRIDSLSTSTPKHNFFREIDRMPSNTSANSSSPAETVISDNISDHGYSETENVPDFSVPMVHSSRRLKDKIEMLAGDLNYHQTNVSSTAKEMAAKKLEEQLHIQDRYNDNNSCAFVARTAGELSQPLNIRHSVELYPDLTTIDVKNESIFAAQHKKLTAIRKRVGADKIQRKIEDGLPEPDLLEFFEPNKHLFKSVNLSMATQVINLKPTPSLADRRFYSVFRDRDLLNKFE